MPHPVPKQAQYGPGDDPNSVPLGVYDVLGGEQGQETVAKTNQLGRGIDNFLRGIIPGTLPQAGDTQVMAPGIHTGEEYVDQSGGGTSPLQDYGTGEGASNELKEYTDSLINFPRQEDLEGFGVAENPLEDAAAATAQPPVPPSPNMPLGVEDPGAGAEIPMTAFTNRITESDLVGEGAPMGRELGEQIDHEDSRTIMEIITAIMGGGPAIRGARAAGGIGQAAKNIFLRGSPSKGPVSKVGPRLQLTDQRTGLPPIALPRGGGRTGPSVAAPTPTPTGQAFTPNLRQGTTATRQRPSPAATRSGQAAQGRMDPNFQSVKPTARQAPEGKTLRDYTTEGRATAQATPLRKQPVRGGGDKVISQKVKPGEETGKFDTRTTKPRVNILEDLARYTGQAATKAKPRGVRATKKAKTTTQKNIDELEEKKKAYANTPKTVNQEWLSSLTKKTDPRRFFSPEELKRRFSKEDLAALQERFGTVKKISEAQIKKEFPDFGDKIAIGKGF